MNWSDLWLETVGDDYNRSARKKILDRAAKILGGKSHKDYPWQDISRSDMERLKREYAEMDMAPSTIRYQLVTVRSLCTLIHEEGGMDELRLRSLRRCEIPPKAGNGHVGRKLSTEECADIFSLPISTRAERMRLAQFAVLITTGVRASELCSLRTDSITEDGVVTLFGKGGKKRHVSIVPAIKSVVDMHRQDCDDSLPWLIQNVLVEPYQLDRRRVLSDMKLLAKSAGIEPFSAHDCRRTAASLLMDKGVDVFTVADLLGHSSVDTTRMYDRRPYEQKLDAMKYLGQAVMAGS